MRLDALHDLMRMELPDRWSDVVDNPIAPAFFYPPGPAPIKIARPAVSQNYLRRLIQAAGNGPYSQAVYDNQGAECLYLIVMSALAEEGDASDVFRTGDTGDTDGDGLPEFIDGWGKPIKFVRWPAGFTSELQVVGSGQVDSSSPSGQTCTIRVNVNAVAPPVPNGNFSSVSGSYVGGAVAVRDTNVSVPQMAGNRIARITGYVYDPPSGKATITCTTPTGSTTQAPFGCGNPAGGPPNGGEEIYILGADPFDQSGIYPIYPAGASFPGFPSQPPETSIPSFATYPLIYSAGPDKEYGILSVPDNVNGYTKNAVYPILFDLTSAQLIGSCSPTPLLDETSSTAWRDNIHNHVQGTR
jgi:hypothetical protein